MKHLLLMTILMGSFWNGANAVEKPLKESSIIEVPVYLLEALAPRDTTSSEAFQKEFQGTADIATRLMKQRLKTCGYELKPHFSFYHASDPLHSFESAVKADRSGAWFIIGPRRSDHYILSSEGATTIPSVSVMASSSKIDELGPLHISIYPSNKVLANAASKATSELARSKKREKTYFSVVSDDCLNCADSGHADHRFRRMPSSERSDASGFSLCVRSRFLRQCFLSQLPPHRVSEHSKLQAIV